MALKTMSVAKLQELKSKVEAAISAKVTERRRELESELFKLSGFGGRGRAGRGGARGPVAPNTAIPRTRPRPGLAAGFGPAGLQQRSRAARNLRILPSIHLAPSSRKRLERCARHENDLRARFLDFRLSKTTEADPGCRCVGFGHHR
jgi:hypothetical protein